MFFKRVVTIVVDVHMRDQAEFIRPVNTLPREAWPCEKNFGQGHSVTAPAAEGAFPSAIAGAGAPRSAARTSSRLKRGDPGRLDRDIYATGFLFVRGMEDRWASRAGRRTIPSACRREGRKTAAAHSRGAQPKPPRKGQVMAAERSCVRDLDRAFPAT